jgi:hypothetical protein
MIRGGLTVSGIYGLIDNTGAEIDSKCKAGLFLNSTISAAISKKFTFQIELNYEEKASNTDYIIEGYAHIMKEDLDYISIPLLLKFKITEKPMISIYSGVYIQII